ncbi:hypothetical protein E4U55_004885 [Claviceps digitariae]|nr:hypothetical protein E4U55_004885 [Claviceps digitariae]
MAALLVSTSFAGASFARPRKVGRGTSIQSGAAVFVEPTRDRAETFQMLTSARPAHRRILAGKRDTAAAVASSNGALHTEWDGLRNHAAGVKISQATGAPGAHELRSV